MITVTKKVFMSNGRSGRKRLSTTKPAAQAVLPGRVPRISKLMALAIKFDGLIQDGIVKDYADLARLGYVSRARITQVMNLNYLAPDIQEEILDLPRTTKGRDPVSERHVREMTGVLDWAKQRRMWGEIAGGAV